jgi:hypothetical protein
MPSQLSQAEHLLYIYRYISKEYRRLAAEDCSNETRCYYLEMAANYRTLADTPGFEYTEPVMSDLASPTLDAGVVALAAVDARPADTEGLRDLVGATRPLP